MADLKANTQSYYRHNGVTTYISCGNYLSDNSLPVLDQKTKLALDWFIHLSRSLPPPSAVRFETDHKYPFKNSKRLIRSSVSAIRRVNISKPCPDPRRNTYSDILSCASRYLIHAACSLDSKAFCFALYEAIRLRHGLFIVVSNVSTCSWAALYSAPWLWARVACPASRKRQKRCAFISNVIEAVAVLKK